MSMVGGMESAILILNTVAELVWGLGVEQRGKAGLRAAR